MSRNESCIHDKRSGIAYTTIGHILTRKDPFKSNADVLGTQRGSQVCGNPRDSSRNAAGTWYAELRVRQHRLSGGNEGLAELTDSIPTVWQV